MIEFFQITGSSSFAVRCALEEIGVAYEAIDIAPFDRSQPPRFAEVNPLRSVPAIRDGDTDVYEIGACLLYLAERFPEAGLAPAFGDPARGPYLRWMVWLADAFRPLWERIMAPFFFTTESEPGVRAKGLEDAEQVGRRVVVVERGQCGDRHGARDVSSRMTAHAVGDRYEPRARVDGVLVVGADETDVRPRGEPQHEAHRALICVARERSCRF